MQDRTISDDRHTHYEWLPDNRWDGLDVRSRERNSPDEEPNRLACVLIAHGNRKLRDSLAAELGWAGYLVHQVDDGIQALEWLSDRLTGGLVPEKPDLIIADMTLPGRKGIDLLADLTYAGWATPFILIAENQDYRLAEDARRIGCQTVFKRPFDLDDLLTAVEFLLPGMGLTACRRRPSRQRLSA